MRLLDRLRHDVADRHVEIFSFLALKRILDEHARDCPERFQPHLALVGARNIEAAELEFRGRLAGAELDPSIAHQVKRGNAFRDSRRMVVRGRQQRDAVAKANVLVR